ncbi:hypothetical protein Cni_G26746 [Canna indica]|uniref:Uncharacterized protein n=1 Tax=Canna indica TaxID=4628 RepID=A0AAQ3QQP6_9LILI|nr:hypothetical protein Cni_G26746 [Canna indica]
MSSCIHEPYNSNHLFSFLCLPPFLSTPPLHVCFFSIRVLFPSDDAGRRPAIAALLRALRPPRVAPPHPAPRGPIAGRRGGEEAPARPDDAGEFRLAPPGGVAGADALRLRHLRYRIHADALGDRARNGVLLLRDRLELVWVREGRPLPQQWSLQPQGDCRTSVFQISNFVVINKQSVYHISRWKQKLSAVRDLLTNLMPVQYTLVFIYFFQYNVPVDYAST